MLDSSVVDREFVGVLDSSVVDRKFVGVFMSYLRYLCLLAYSGVQHILCCIFICRLVYPMSPVSQDCPF